MRRVLAVIFVAFLAATSLTQCVARTKFYSVWFMVTVNSADKISSLQVVQVRTVEGPSSHPAHVIIPASYVAAARAFLSKRPYKGPSQFVDYTFYDPSQPTRADINPRVAQ